MGNSSSHEQHPIQVYPLPKWQRPEYLQQLHPAACPSGTEANLYTYYNNGMYNMPAAPLARHGLASDSPTAWLMPPPQPSLVQNPVQQLDCADYYNNLPTGCDAYLAIASGHAQQPEQFVPTRTCTFIANTVCAGSTGGPWHAVGVQQQAQQAQPWLASAPTASQWGMQTAAAHTCSDDFTHSHFESNVIGSQAAADQGTGLAWQVTEPEIIRAAALNAEAEMAAARKAAAERAAAEKAAAEKAAAERAAADRAAAEEAAAEKAAAEKAAVEKAAAERAAAEKAAAEKAAAERAAVEKAAAEKAAAEKAAAEKAKAAAEKAKAAAEKAAAEKAKAAAEKAAAEKAKAAAEKAAAEKAAAEKAAAEKAAAETAAAEKAAAEKAKAAAEKAAAEKAAADKAAAEKAAAETAAAEKAAADKAKAAAEKAKQEAEAKAPKAYLAPKPAVRMYSVGRCTEERYKQLDDHATSCPASACSSIAALVKHLISGCNNAEERVRVVHRWVCANIRYNYQALESPALRGTQSAEQVFTERKGVCEGYARLMEAMCKEANVECKYLVGQSKGVGWEQKGSRASAPPAGGHAWNAVKLGDGASAGWALLDATWCAGKADSGSDKAGYNDVYFLTRPDIMISDHWPEDKAWALLPGAVPDWLEFRDSIFYKASAGWKPTAATKSRTLKCKVPAGVGCTFTINWETYLPLTTIRSYKLVTNGVATRFETWKQVWVAPKAFQPQPVQDGHQLVTIATDAHTSMDGTKQELMVTLPCSSTSIGTQQTHKLSVELGRVLNDKGTYQPSTIEYEVQTTVMSQQEAAEASQLTTDTQCELTAVAIPDKVYGCQDPAIRLYAVGRCTEERYKQLDDHAISCPASACSSIAALVKHLVSGFSNAEERVRVVHRWVCENIKFDCTHTAQQAGDVLTRRAGTSMGYANIFKAMCQAAGVQCSCITGWCKRMGKWKEHGAKALTPWDLHNHTHTWNAVRLGEGSQGGWALLDCTLAAATPQGSSTVMYDDVYFLTQPNLFINTHFPANRHWALMDKAPHWFTFRDSPVSNLSDGWKPMEAKSFIRLTSWPPNNIISKEFYVYLPHTSVRSYKLVSNDTGKVEREEKLYKLVTKEGGKTEEEASDDIKWKGNYVTITFHGPSCKAFKGKLLVEFQRRKEGSSSVFLTTAELAVSVTG